MKRTCLLLILATLLLAGCTGNPEGPGSSEGSSQSGGELALRLQDKDVAANDLLRVEAVLDNPTDEAVTLEAPTPCRAVRVQASLGDELIPLEAAPSAGCNDVEPPVVVPADGLATGPYRLDLGPQAPRNLSPEAGTDLTVEAWADTAGDGPRLHAEETVTLVAPDPLPRVDVEPRNDSWPRGAQVAVDLAVPDPPRPLLARSGPGCPAFEAWVTPADGTPPRIPLATSGESCDDGPRTAVAEADATPTETVTWDGTLAGNGAGPLVETGTWRVHARVAAGDASWNTTGSAPVDLEPGLEVDVDPVGAPYNVSQVRPVEVTVTNPTEHALGLRGNGTCSSLDVTIEHAEGDGDPFAPTRTPPTSGPCLTGTLDPGQAATTHVAWDGRARDQPGFGLGPYAPPDTYRVEARLGHPDTPGAPAAEAALDLQPPDADNESLPRLDLQPDQLSVEAGQHVRVDAFLHLPPDRSFGLPDFRGSELLVDRPDRENTTLWPPPPRVHGTGSIDPVYVAPGGRDHYVELWPGTYTPEQRPDEVEPGTVNLTMQLHEPGENPPGPWNISGSVTVDLEPRSDGPRLQVDPVETNLTEDEATTVHVNFTNTRDEPFRWTGLHFAPCHDLRLYVFDDGRRRELGTVQEEEPCQANETISPGAESTWKTPVDASDLPGEGEQTIWARFFGWGHSWFHKGNATVTVETDGGS